MNDDAHFEREDIDEALHYVGATSADPDIEEDRCRYEEYKRTGLAVSLDDVKAWVAGWGSAGELPRPQARKIG